MRNKNNKHLGIEVDPELHYKLRYIAKYEGRSANSQLIKLMLQFIADYEKEHGKINLEETK